jgi:hypothetical protein
VKLQRKVWGLPKRALRGLLFAGGKFEAFKAHRGAMRFLADGPSLSLRFSYGHASGPEQRRLRAEV